MPDPSAPGRTLSLSADRRHDLICDRFEEARQAGQDPPVEDLLAEVPAGERDLLFAALLRVEFDRRPPGPDTAAAYRARFPAYANLVDEALAARDPAATGPLPDADAGPPVIHGYELLGPLGRGGMGVVFRGRHVGLDRPVAVKVVRADAASADLFARFEVEARAVAGLSHPHVVTLYDFGRAAGRPYLVMEFVDGGSLADRLGGAPADPAWAAGLVEPLARAVQYIHDKGILHRDLKPANVLLAADGTPKVTDFGLAKRLAADGPALTATHAILGSPCYMSPEQARGDPAAVGRAADVYGLGAVLYECLTGRPPFHAGSYALTVARVLADDPARPTDLVPGVPADLEAVCLKCLEKDPARRYESAAALADDLARWRRGEPPLARPLDAAGRHARWAQRAGFELGERLGEAGGAVTYRARQTILRRGVRLRLPAGPAAHATLRREAGALGGLHSPYVIRLYDYGDQFGLPYLVLEDVAGGHPPGGRPVSARRAAAVGLMLALGLEAVHDHGHLLGGLWPGAFVRAPDDTPTIVDLAAARRRDDVASPVPDWVPAAFLAPEVRAGDWDRVGPAADFFALGAVLHDLAYGEPPGPVPRRGAAPDLDAVIARCLHPDPAGRPPTVGALQLDLQLAAGQRPPAAEDPSDGSVTVLPPDGPGPARPAADRPTRYRLRVTGGPRLVGRTFELPRARVLIGRGTGGHVVLPDGDKLVSREHCRVVWDGGAGGHAVVDMGQNGTYVNGEKVRDRRPLAAGDRIAIGGYELAFEPLPAGDG